MNKIMRYCLAVLSALMIVPLFLNCWNYKVEGSKAYLSSWGLFADIKEFRAWKDFSSFWFVLFGILAIILVLVSIIIAVIFIVNHNKGESVFLKEKQLSNIHLGLSLLTALVGGIIPFVYSKQVSANGFSAVDTLRHTIVPAVGFYFLVVLSFVLTLILIFIAEDYRKNKNKKKR